MKVNLFLENKVIAKKNVFLSIQNQFKNRTLRFRFFANIELSPHFFYMMLPIFKRTTHSEIK